MNTQPTPLLSEFEQGLPIPEGELAYFRERTRNRLYNFVVSKFLEREAADNLTKADLARRINQRPERVNRLLGAPENWTIDTISDLLVGIAAEELDPASSSLNCAHSTKMLRMALAWE